MRFIAGVYALLLILGVVVVAITTSTPGDQYVASFLGGMAIGFGGVGLVAVAFDLY